MEQGPEQGFSPLPAIYRTSHTLGISEVARLTTGRHVIAFLDGPTFLLVSVYATVDLLH